MKNIKYFIILSTIFLIIFHIFNNKNKLIENLKLEEKFCKKNYILQIYQMLYDINYLLNKNKIIYYIDGGTLLGAVRHKGIIPWDDDGDICIFNKDVKKFLRLKKSFNNLGYNIVKYWGGYKIYYINGRKINLKNTNWSWNNKKLDQKRKNIKYRFPFVDVSIVKDEEGIIKYDNNLVQKIWKKCNYNKKDMFPLKNYKFGIFQLKGPNNPINYLNNCYGNNWKTVKYDNYDHLNQRFKNKIKKTMTKNNYLPAKPLKPIIFKG